MSLACQLPDSEELVEFVLTYTSAMTQALVYALLSTVLFGIVTSLALTSTYILASGGRLRHRAYQLQLYATVVLYVSTTIFWVTSLYTILVIIRTSGWRAYMCLNDESAYRSRRSETRNLGCLQTASLTINIIVGDAIVWWRASVLCQWTGRSRYAIHLVCFMILSSTFATSVAGTCNACGPSTAHLSAPGYHPGQLFSGTMLGASASVLTLLSNIITVALTLYKACAHVKFRNMDASRERRATQVQKTLALLIESGLIYCAIWLLVSIYQLGTNVSTIYDDVVDIDYWEDVPVTFWTVMSYFVSGALIPVIAIYPMAIIVMVALRKSPGTSVSVSMPASSALSAQRREAHADRLRDGTSYPMMTLAWGRGPSNSELAEEESVDESSVAKRQVIELA